MSGQYETLNDAGNKTCIDCGEGTYSPLGLYCLTCGPGYLTDDRVNCVVCAAGTYSNDDLNVECLECPPGKYSASATGPQNGCFDDVPHASR